MGDGQRQRREEWDGARSLFFLFFLRSGERGGRMGQTEGVMAPRGPSQVGPLAGEGHVYVAKLLFPPPSRLGPTLPASHLPELFPECGIWVREGEGQRGC